MMLWQNLQAMENLAGPADNADQLVNHQPNQDFDDYLNLNRGGRDCTSGNVIRLVPQIPGLVVREVAREIRYSPAFYCTIFSCLGCLIGLIYKNHKDFKATELIYKARLNK